MTRRATTWIVLAIACGFIVLSPRNSLAAHRPSVAALRVDGRVDPVGTRDSHPTFSWQLTGDRQGLMQTAYQVRLASHPERLSDGVPHLWDSGRVETDQSADIVYAGQPLAPTHTYHWQVRVWDEQGEATDWSVPAEVVTGLFSDQDWQASWITMHRTDRDPLPIFRKSFRIDQSIKQAVIHICGLGQYELRINGQRVGAREMDPGWTNYRQTCLYSSHDVTRQLSVGENVIGVLLGNGMYNVPGGRYAKFTGSFGPPKLICQLHVVLADGSTQVLGSDATWKSALGPITFSCIYGGEDIDARREPQGWQTTGFDDHAWSSAAVCQGPGGRLVAQTAPPVQVADRLEATQIERLANGSYEIDCGVNLSARPVIKVAGKSGQQVTITCAEQRGKPWPGHSHTYTLSGQDEETFRPRFTYFSFRYLYVSGVRRPADEHHDDTKPLLLEAGSEFLTSSATAVGSFHCSNPLLNDIDAMITRSVRSNLQSVLTDCPHREKLGWLEVSHLMGPSILYRYDAQQLFRKICRDTTESQLESGLVPDIAPEYTRFKDGFRASAEWGSACVQLPWLLYRWYGDRQVLQSQFDTMARYVRYLSRSRNAAGLVQPGLGDWYDWTPEAGHVGPSQLTPAELPATALLYDDARILVRVAELLGRKDERAEFEDLSEHVRDDFLTAYYRPTTYTVATGSQASLATALYYDLVPREDRDRVLATLIAELHRVSFRQSTGEVCFRMLLQTLADAGRSDVVFKILNRTDSPGYGHMLALGFQTLSERWDQPGSSMNHCMFGHAQEWFHTSILGIQQAPDSFGFRQLILRPQPVGDLTSAVGYYDGIRGHIESRWKIEKGRFDWHVVIPPNTTAVMYMPAIDAQHVTIGNVSAEQIESIRLVGMESTPGESACSTRAVFSVGAGVYDLRSDVEP